MAEYEYDGRNFRTVKKVYAGGGLSETRHFYYNDAWQCLEERVEASTTAACQYVWATATWTTLSSRPRYGRQRHVGRAPLRPARPELNVIAIADTGGDVSRRYAYSAYGQPVFLRPIFVSYGGNVGKWEVLYTGQRYDRETGLYNYLNRYYHPDLGRFVSRAPIGYSAGSNLYEYVGDSPLRRTDPRGLAWGNSDFAWHYYFGGGAAVNLAGAGLLDTFRNAPDVQRSVIEFRQLVKSELGNRSQGVDCDTYGDSSFVMPFFYMDEDTTDVTNKIFSVGHSTFFRAASCRIQWGQCDRCCQKTGRPGRTFTGTCSLTFHIEDEFAKPLTFIGWNHEALGTPYDIDASFTEQITTSGDTCQGFAW